MPFRRLFPFSLALVPFVALAACGDNGGPGLDTDYPPAGEDRFERTIATVEIDVTLPGVGALPVALGELETVEMEGPMLVLRGDPQDSDGDGLVDIETEIVEMTLTGTSSFGPLEVRQSPDRRSMGMVEQQKPGQDFPADSFFDVFLEVEVLDINLVGYHEDPIRMEAELSDLPPGFRDQYRGALVLPTPLLSAESHVEFARILDALHVPNPPSGSPAPTPGATPTSAPTPTEAPTDQQVEVEVAGGCEHTEPGVQSDLVALVLAALVGAAPVEGATVEVSADGPGILEGTATGVTNADGAASLRFPINQFGPYEITVERVIGPDGAPLEIAPGSQTSTTYEVEDLCTLPFGFEP